MPNVFKRLITRWRATSPVRRSAEPGARPTREIEMRPETKAQIEREIRQHKILLFMKGSRDFPQCGFSAAAVDRLEKLGVDFHTIDVLADGEIREGIKAYTNWPTIPQLYVDGRFIGGCDIVRELYATGELKQIVQGSGIQPAA
jgi:monothiol glutaredoxin